MPKKLESNQNKWDVIDLEALEIIEEFKNIKIQDNKKTKNILLIGRTGNGKSTLANVLINKNNDFEEVFKENNKSVSGTKNFQVEEMEIDGKNYKIIDTVGFGDTILEITKIPLVFEEMDEYVKNGVDHVFLVIKEKFIKEDSDILKYLKEVFFDESVINYISLVRTDFHDFEEEEECEQDICSLLTESSEVTSEFINELHKEKIIHVDNPPINMKGKRREKENFYNRRTREVSREILLNHLRKYQNEKSCEPKSGNLIERIKLMNEKELVKLQEKTKDIGEWLEKINIFIKWRGEMKEEVHKYVESLLGYVEKCEFSAEFGKNVSQAGKSWMEISNDSVIVAVKGIYGKPIGLVMRVVGETTEIGSEIFKLITQKIYEEKLSSKVKEGKEKSLSLLKRDLASKIKDCDFKFREQLAEEQTSGVLGSLKEVLKPLSDKLIKWRRGSTSNVEDEDNIESLGEEEQTTMRILLSTLIKRKAELFFEQLEEEMPIIEAEREKLESEHEKTKREAKEFKEKLERERVNFEMRMSQIQPTK